MKNLLKISAILLCLSGSFAQAQATKNPGAAVEITCLISSISATTKDLEESDFVFETVIVKGNSTQLMSSTVTLGSYDYELTIFGDYNVPGLFEANAIVMDKGAKVDVRKAIAIDNFLLKYAGNSNSFTPGTNPKSRLDILMGNSLSAASALWVGTNKIVKFLKANPSLATNSVDLERRRFTNSSGIEVVMREALKQGVIAEGELVAIGPMFGCGMNP